MRYRPGKTMNNVLNVKYMTVVYFVMIFAKLEQNPIDKPSREDIR